MSLSWFEAEMQRLLGQGWQRMPPPPEPRPPYASEELIPRLCRESGRWLVVRREGDRYIVQCRDHRPVLEIIVRSSGEPNEYTVLFQAWFSVRFSLENPPSGLFGRLLLRNLDLHFAAWALSIGGSCEACPTVWAIIPRAALNARLFDDVCTEIRDEMLGFHIELCEKFRFAPPSPVRGSGGGPPEVRYVEPTRPVGQLSDEEIADQIIRDASGRYRLPRPGE